MMYNRVTVQPTNAVNDVMVTRFAWGAIVPHLTVELIGEEERKLEEAFSAKCAIVDESGSELSIQPRAMLYVASQGWFSTIMVRDRIVQQFHGRTMEQAVACMMIWISAITTAK